MQLFDADDISFLIQLFIQHTAGISDIMAYVGLSFCQVIKLAMVLRIPYNDCILVYCPISVLREFKVNKLGRVPIRGIP